jgi:hypothetical protein
MDILELEKLLMGTKFDCFIGNIHKIELKGFSYNDVFKIGNNNLGYYALKIRENDQRHLFDSIHCLNILNDPENIINKNTDIIEKEHYIIMVSDWINGKQPMDNNRDQIPVFFSKMAFLNKQNIVKGPYTSMYVDGNYFDSIHDLIDWEINYHRGFLHEMPRMEIVEILKNLNYGLSCIIIEEINTGNLFLTDDGKYKFIDTEWMHKGLNLYQFDHINYFGFEEKTWYNITDEAEECYRAYFDTLKVKNENANEQIRAIELLSLLRQNTILKFHGKENNDFMKKIRKVMEKEKYI